MTIIPEMKRTGITEMKKKKKKVIILLNFTVSV
jgi:hypothetical protein